jgi:hypothetical protein
LSKGDKQNTSNWVSWSKHKNTTTQRANEDDAHLLPSFLKVKLFSAKFEKTRKTKNEEKNEKKDGFLRQAF